MKKVAKIIFRVLEYLFGIAFLAVFLSKGSDQFLGTHIEDTLAEIPFVASFFELGEEEYLDVSFEDPYYQQLLRVIEQITPTENIELIQWYSGSDTQKIFRIDEHDGKRNIVVVDLEEGQYYVKIQKYKK